MVKLSLKFLVVGALIGCLLVFYRANTVSQARELRVVAVEQPGSALRIVLTSMESKDPLRPRYGYTITNIVDQPIAAYAIRESGVMPSGVLVNTTTFLHFPSVDVSLRPYETKYQEGTSGITYKEPPKEIRLSVDFVEFVDGSRWGEDSSKSGERMDGKRAGGKAAIKKYRDVLDAGGLKSFQSVLSEPAIVNPDESASDQWKEGFKSGVSLVRKRLTAVKNSSDIQEIKKELAKPFDTVSGRQNP
jgi:hypothetical protein